MKLKSSLLTCVALSVAQPVAGQAPAPVVTRVYMAPACIITSAPPDDGHQLIGAIAAIIVPVILGYVIDAIVADLSKIRKQESSGSLDLTLYSFNRSVSRYPVWDKRQQCVTVITSRATGGGSRQLDAVTATQVISADSPLADVERRLAENGIKDLGQVYSIFEAELVPSDDQTAFRYEPKYYRLDRMLPGDRRSKQGVAYNLSLNGPGPTPNSVQYTSAVIQIGEVAAPTLLHIKRDTRKLNSMRSGYIQRPGLTPAAYVSFLRHTRVPKPESLRLMPATFKAELVQTIKPTDVARFAAAILAGSKAGLVAAAGKELTPLDAAAERQKVLNAEVAIKTAQSELATARAANDQPKIDLALAKLAAAQDLLNSLQ